MSGPGPEGRTRHWLFSRPSLRRAAPWEYATQPPRADCVLLTVAFLSAVLSQSEWNDKQRSERKQEFAPPSFYEDRQGSSSISSERRPDRRHKMSARDEDKVGLPPPSGSPPLGPPSPSSSTPSGPVPAWMSVPCVPPPAFMPPVHLPPPGWPPHPVPPPQPPLPPEDPDDTRGGLFFTSKRPKRDWRAAQKGEVRLPMEEVEDFSEPPPPGTKPPSPPPALQCREKKGGSVAGGVGAEIAPPPTIEYFGPSESATERSRRAGQSSGQADLSSAISAGLRFLREEAEKKERKRTDKGWAEFV